MTQGVGNGGGGRMDGKVVLITGGTSGIGRSAATSLAAMGADVVVVGRNAERGQRAVEEIRAESGGKVDLALYDLSVQAEVLALASEFQNRYDRLDVLVNNAGLVNSTRSETPDGMEATLAINHLAPFLLTSLLLDLLKESVPSRIVTTSSEAQRWGDLDFSDLQSRENYRGFPVYGMTKLANILFTYELAERLAGTGVTANCLHPGAVGTNFGRNNTGPMTLFFRAAKPFMRTPEQGADTLVWLASAPELEGVTGRYYSDRKEVRRAPERGTPEQKRLWEESERLTGVAVAS